MTDKRPFLAFDRVRWADVDLVGIMRFSAFTRLVEVAEQELMREAGIPFSELLNEPTIWLPRRHLEIDYFAPVHIDDELTLVTYVSRIGDTSATINLDVRSTSDWTLIATSAMVIVCVTKSAFVKRSLPDEVRTALTPFLMSPEEARFWPQATLARG